MTYKHVLHPFPNEEGQFPKIINVNYTLWYNDGVLIDIRNEYHHSVSKNSEVWSFYSK